MFVNIYIYMFVNIYIYILVGGMPTPLKNMKVSWDCEIPNIWKIKNMFQTTNHIPDAPCMVYLPTFTRTKSPSFVGKYLIHGEKPCSKPPISINKW